MRRRISILIVCLFTVVSVLSGARPAEADQAGDKLYIFDLKAFIDQKKSISSKLAYDYLKLASALQGLANREQPQIYYFYETNGVAAQSGIDTDRYWYEKLNKPGEYLSGFDSVTETDFFSLMSRFDSLYEGIVLWDENVPATANVASTIAGVDKLLPVRYDPSAGSVYDEMVVQRGIEVKRNLVGKFTGTGMIPDIDQPSSGSAKNDAYLWAKALYLDTGRTHPTLMANALDGVSWHLAEGPFSFSMYSAYIPKRMNVGEEVEVAVTVQNAGQKDWKLTSLDRLKSEGANQLQWIPIGGGFSDSLTDQRIYLNPEDSIEPGERKTFRFRIKAPSVPGTYMFAAGMVRDGVQVMSGQALHREIEIVAAEPEAPGSEETEPVEGGPMQPIDQAHTPGGEFNAKFASGNIPDVMKAGQRMNVALTVDNTGTTVWTAETLDRLGSPSQNALRWDRMLGYSVTPDNQRIYLAEDDRIESGQSKTFTFTLVAPSTPGNYAFAAEMIRDGHAWYGNRYTKTIAVTQDGVIPDPPEEELIPYEPFIYPDLYNTNLPNADYYIANKAFFFDLSPDHTSIPNDDKGQPLGTDYNTLTSLLLSQNEKAGQNIITVGGFVPFFIKYSNMIDDSANYDPVMAEWTYVDILSKYNAQLDADAYGMIGISNASVYQSVPPLAEYKQNNDKGANGKTFDPNKKYVTFYMSDYDAASWTYGALPAMWDDPKRGELPLAWSLVPNTSNRVPMVYNRVYSTLTPNDYIVAGDNGAGYLNPMMLTAGNRPDGLPPFLNVWEAYNKQWFAKYDLDITGFLISGLSWTVSKEVQEAYSRISPAGVGTNSGFEEPIVNGTPFAAVSSLGWVQETDPVALGKKLATALKRTPNFLNTRILLTKPSVIVDAVDYVKTHYPELDFEVVDPYTYFRLYKEAGTPVGDSARQYTSMKADARITVDGKLDDSEWKGAEELTVSKNADDVKKFGTVWGGIAEDEDLTARYRIKWDDENLYFSERRTANALHFTETGEKMYLSDATMLFLDLKNEKSGFAFRDGDYAIFMTPGGPDGKPHIFLREGRSGGQVEYTLDGAEGVELASHIEGTTYKLEAKIPWSKLQVAPFQPKKGGKIGMTLLATHDGGLDKWGQIMWVGNGDDQSNWGDMKFVQGEPIPGDGGGNGGSIPGGYWPAAASSPNKMESIIAVRGSGTVKLGEELVLDIPADASEQAMRITIEKLTGIAGLIGDDDVLLSSVFELLKDTEGKFSKPVKIKMVFDPSKLKPGQRAVIAYYDEAAKKWIEIGGIVEGSAITAEVVHFTKFAVMGLPEQAKPDPETEIGISFTDTAGHWAANRIAEAATRGIVKGYDDGSFRPGAAITRAEFVAMLIRAIQPGGEPGALAFKDADRIGSWAKDALALAVGAGIVTGYGDGTIRPDDAVTRAEMTAMTLRAAGIPAAEAAKTTFTDDAKLAAWARGFIAEAAEQGFVHGKGGNRFAPDDRSSRAEAVVLLLNVLESKEG
ncbi:S-layer homology domain-containing protein [Paenibacillus mendelii]|uniref:S-layer homology domain-containing protein n=1 Tax=Paenibacillus mendelii TaxID=206163 RepID=A0ABV6JQ88_9BACL|nr:S-layer homology domain-containing protein [Paenibacillus mendelii]MCQ6562285.1 S-layer homology domain-containing protein [Paenibacillus mendelii]